MGSYYWYTETTPHWQTAYTSWCRSESDQRVQNIRHSNYTHESKDVHIRMPLIDNALGRPSPSWPVADYTSAILPRTKSGVVPPSPPRTSTRSLDPVRWPRSLRSSSSGSSMVCMEGHCSDDFTLAPVAVVACSWALALVFIQQAMSGLLHCCHHHPLLISSIEFQSFSPFCLLFAPHGGGSTVPI